MSGTFTAACVQLSSGREVAPNLAAAEKLVRAARAAGAELIMTPETTDMLEPKRRLREEKLQDQASHAGVRLFQDLAKELDCWLLAGSMMVRQDPAKPANRSFLFSPSGDIAAQYDKIHMFDVEIPDGQSYRESNAYEAGGQAVMADLPWGPIGLTICYDLRFPSSLPAFGGTRRALLDGPFSLYPLYRQGPLACPAACPGH